MAQKVFKSGYVVGALAIAGLHASSTVYAQSTDTAPPPATETPAAAPSTAAPATETPAATVPTPPADTTPAAAPEATDPNALPEVEVIQKDEPKPQPEKQAVKKPPQAKKVTSPPPQAPPPAATPDPEPVQAETAPQPTAPPSSGPPATNTAVKTSPLGGSEIPLEKIPAGVSVVSSAAVERDGSKQIQNALAQNVPGIILSDTGGSGFRTDVSYRGFDASPIGGRSQGLAVYQQGVRINESFGDTVNWDLIPSNAIDNIAVISGNPVFGLNAIGGAISLTMKDGFSYQGAEIDAMGGSFGRRQVAVQAGGNSGGFGVYAAGEALKEDGFRDFSDASIERMYADLGFKGTSLEVHLNFTGANSSAGVVSAAAVDLLALDWGRTFTSPQVTDLEVAMPTINAKLQATETLTLSANAYYRRFKSDVIDGNLAEPEACSFDASILCLTDDGEEEEVRDGQGNTVSSAIGDPLGSIERINTDAKSSGIQLQAVEKSRLFGFGNQFLIGGAYDHGKVNYSTSSELGEIGDRFVVSGSGVIVVSPDDLAPRLLTTENDYYGLYFSNAIDLTEQFTLTFGGRYNHATITLADLTGNFPELNVTNEYHRFNPTVGGTYKFTPNLSLYGGYSESNRAPTAAELACAEPENPCLIESFLTDDPPLKQVVSKSWEVGLRGETHMYDQQKVRWSLGYFNTLNEDDILNVAATTTGRGYFLNAGDTLRQGIEASIGYDTQRWQVYASYAYIDAQFESDLILPAPNTPGAGPCPVTDDDADEEANCNFVESGDTLPGIPKHRFKAGFNYWLTPKWKFGADMIAASDQVFFGDDANINQRLGGYTRVDFNTSYDVTENIQIYGLVRNLFDQRYGLYGTFFDTEEAAEAAEPSGVTLENPRSIVPAQPFAAYGGLKIKF